MFKRVEKPISDEQAIKNLPHSRKEVFFDLMSHRKMTLFALSCFTFMFFIPLAIDVLYFNFLESMAIISEKYEYLFSLIFYSMLIMIPCMMLGFLGLVGAFYTAKKMVWQESNMFSIDFFNGIKENWKHALISGLLFGVALFGLVVGSSYLLIYSPTAPIWCGIGIGALVLIFLLIGIVGALTFTQDVYYSNSYFVTFKNSFAFMGLLNWKVLILFLLSTCVVVGLSMINFVTMVIGLALFAILNSVVIVIYTLMSHEAFDKYINKDNYPEMVGKGLYKDNKEA